MDCSRSRLRTWPTGTTEPVPSLAKSCASSSWSTIFSSPCSTTSNRGNRSVERASSTSIGGRRSVGLRHLQLLTREKRFADECACAVSDLPRRAAGRTRCRRATARRSTACITACRPRQTRVDRMGRKRMYSNMDDCKTRKLYGIFEERWTRAEREREPSSS